MSDEPADGSWESDAGAELPVVAPPDLVVSDSIGGVHTPEGEAGAGDDEASTLQALHEVTRALVEAEDPARVGLLAVAAARDVLDLPLSGVHLEQEGALEPVAVTEGVVEQYGEVPAIEDPENPATTAYRDGEPIAIGETDVPGIGTVPAAAVPSDGGLLLPLGDHGVFLMTTPDERRLDETEVSFARTLAANTTTALDAVTRQRELERQNERLETFAAMLSHDLRNPLMMLEGNLELARSTGEDEYFQKAEEALGRMDELIDQVLVLAKSGDAVGELEWVDLETAVRQAWSEVDTLTLELSVATPPGLRVHADPDRLRQLLANLLRNAVEHGSTSPRSLSAPEDAVEHGSTSPRSLSAPEDAVEHGSTSPPSQAQEDAVEHGSTSPAPQARQEADSGEVTSITVGVDGDVIYVADDGVGIPEGERQEVFEYGYTTAPEGSGLGLRIVAELADAHGWTPRATESDSGGTRIELEGVDVRDVSG